MFILSIKLFALANQNTFAQWGGCIINHCEIETNSIIEESYHPQLARTSNGYSITRLEFEPINTITSDFDGTTTCSITRMETNSKSVVISNFGHVNTYINTTVQIEHLVLVA